MGFLMMGQMKFSKNVSTSSRFSSCCKSEHIAIKNLTLKWTFLSNHDNEMLPSSIGNRRRTLPAFDHFAECMKLEIKQNTRLQFSSRMIHFPSAINRGEKRRIRWKVWSWSGPCCTVLKMSIIDPRKEMKSNDEHKIFLFRLFFCNTLFDFLPRIYTTSITFSCFGYSTRNHPFLLWKKSARKAIVLTPFLARKMPNHHLGCGHVDAWSRVMLLQFPSGRFFSFLHYFPFFLPRSNSREEENCVHFGHFLYIFSPRVFSHSVPLLFQSVSECVFLLCSGPEKKVAA